jgi:Ca2+-binding RTX toxin-like protein
MAMPPSQFTPTIETVIAPTFSSGVSISRIHTEIVALANGNTIVGWTDSNVGGNGTFNQIQLKLLDPAGNVVLSPTIGPSLTNNPEIAATADGGFLVAYVVQQQQPPLPPAVFVLRYDSAGMRIGDPIPVNAGTEPVVAVLASGAFAVAYNDGTNIGVKRYDATGTLLGSATANSGAGTELENPTITALADGGFVVTWEDDTGSTSDLYGRKFDAAGAPVGSDFTITLDLAVSGAEVAPLASGGFVVAWIAGADVKAQLFDAAGAEDGGEFDLATSLTGGQSTPHVAAYPGGGFVAVWLDSNGGNTILARVFDDDGVPMTGAFVVNSAQPGSETIPEVAVRPDGSLEFVWALSGFETVIRVRTFVPGTATGDVTGTALNDLLTGDADANTLSGLAGVDRLEGGEGNDVLIGGPGQDALVGGGGIDTATYAASPGAVGVDLSLQTGSSNDAQGDTLSGVENLVGSAFNDVLVGDGGVNSLDGGGGDDTLEGRLGADALIGGAGTDTASYADSIGTVFVNMTLGQGFNNSAHGDTYDGIENVIGSNFNDVLIGAEGVNRLDGAGGNDILVGALGADVLIGGNGIDTVNYQDSIGTVFVNMTLGQGFNNSAHGDTYSGIEAVTGSAHNDFLIGDGANNSLDGWDGDDILVGAGGADFLIGGNGIDTVSYEEAAASVFVNLNIGQGFGNNAQGDAYSGIENVNGTSVADVIIGTTGVNVLNGNDGDDILVGSVGADTLNGGNGADTASYEDNWGAVFINLSTGLGFGNAAEGDVLNGIENATGSIFGDALIGTAGANRLAGNSGNDMLVGHGGADQFVFDAALNAATNLDTITDFAPGEDKILLDNAVFAGLAEGALGLNVFIAAPAATGGSNRIVYDQATGALYYDSDGFGSDPAIQFATLTNRPTLTTADFLVI